MSDDFKADTKRILIERGTHTTLPEPVQLASGQMSRYFIDGKAALCRGDDLATACRVMAAQVADAGIDFDVAGGLTLGADQFAHGIAYCGLKGVVRDPQAAQGPVAPTRPWRERSSGRA